jgi:hypothetical protein
MPQHLGRGTIAKRGYIYQSPIYKWIKWVRSPGKLARVHCIKYRSKQMYRYDTPKQDGVRGRVKNNRHASFPHSSPGKA